MGKGLDRVAKIREKAMQSSILLSLIIWVTKINKQMKNLMKLDET